MKPKPMPSVIENVNGMTMIASAARADREVAEVDPGELARASRVALGTSSASVSVVIIR